MNNYADGARKLCKAVVKAVAKVVETLPLIGDWATDQPYQTNYVTTA